jgi:hypothetical protein
VPKCQWPVLGSSTRNSISRSRTSFVENGGLQIAANTCGITAGLDIVVARGFGRGISWRTSFTKEANPFGSLSRVRGSNTPNPKLRSRARMGACC